MEKPNIALVGFRATGKSAVGRLLAQRLDRTFVDMDERLVDSFGEDIQSRVRSHGWESFREAESALLEELAYVRNLVVATGGGVVIKPFNRERLRTHFFVTWLQASSETIRSRLSGDPRSEAFRPALTDLPLREEIDHLLAERSPWYEDVADLTLKTDALPPHECVEIIREFLYKRFSK